MQKVQKSYRVFVMLQTSVCVSNVKENDDGFFMLDPDAFETSAFTLIGSVEAGLCPNFWTEIC